MYRSALVSVGGYATAVCVVGWFVGGSPRWYGLVALLVLASVPFLRAPASRDLGGARRHQFAIWLGLVVTAAGVVVSASTVVNSFSSRRDPSGGALVFESAMLLACAVAAMSAVAHAWAIAFRGDERRPGAPVRSLADELRFVSRWIAATTTLAAAGWSLMLASTAPFAVLLSGWMVTVMAVLVLESLREQTGTPPRQSKVFSGLSFVVAIAVAVAATAAILSDPSASTLAVSWASVLAALTTMGVVAGDLRHLAHSTATETREVRDAVRSRDSERGSP